MKRINAILLCVISICSILLVVMFCFFSEHSILFFNIRELKKESGVELLCPMTAVGLMYILTAAIVLLFFNIAIFKYRKKPEKVNKGIVAIVAAISFCVMSLAGIMYLLIEGDDKFFCFHSPDSEYSIIAYECAFLYTGRVELYERTSPVTIKAIGTMRTKDGYRPVSDSKYKVVWKENIAEFTIADGAGAIQTQVIELKK